ncbi:uncharacterized protein NFIA_033660 [Aspergillus fischeri NRRL 181]|uniref:Uncharacterized protein n=1 Tax=Neosartorya fischeri (strain ATCC 1020 / DSM 3700 / CBS 544.65 / FGSC A1164 / JCM 1740 / NRRL 181 / WB 181) TaxID=331117 RepID=A1CYI0_NEOFI|nr:uncharacterized protein NFIA_033660 [Aspergillus fischeri NRRL 181]EAW23800.1 hypothetical protein NFIA_033660 [Aspergillus fischeri NRRL 181]
MFFAWSSILSEEEWDEILRLQPVTPRYDEFGDSEECTARTATNYWVSCSGTSCSTTRTAKFTGCSVTNSATTTGQYCPTGVTIDPNDDQGANGYGPISTSIVTTSIPEIAIVRGEPYTVTGGSINLNGAVIKIPNIGGSEQVCTTIDNVPMVIIPNYSGTMAVPVLPTAKPTSGPDPGSGSDPGSGDTPSSTSTTSTTAPIPTSADGCALMGGIQGVCRNKCDPATGNPVGGTWEEGDAWCWLKDGDIGAFCNTEKDCPSKLECQPSDWRRGGCLKPPVVSGGCALMNGIQGVCWSKCDPKTSEPVKEEWNKGDPWCWLKEDDIGTFCKDAKDCPVDLKCQPSSWARGGCSVNTPLSTRDLLVSDNGTSRAIAGPHGVRLDLYF